MSYILDALRKAERERGMAQVPTLTTVHDFREAPRIRMWMISGLSVLCVAAILWFLLPALRTNVEPIPPRTNEPGPVASQSGVEQVQKPVAVNPAPFSPQPSQPPAPKNIPNERRLSPPAQAAVAPQPGVAEHTLPPLQQALGRSNLQEKPQAAAQPKPLPLKEAMAKMNMSILMFSDAKAERLVFINGRKYVEGDYVEGDYLLENITPEGAILSYEGESAILRPGSK